MFSNRSSPRFAVLITADIFRMNFHISECMWYNFMFGKMKHFKSLYSENYCYKNSTTDCHFVYDRGKATVSVSGHTKD